MLRAATLAALSLLVTLLVACGSGAAGGDDDPASAVPANAILYAEVVIQPDGDLKDDALDAAGKVLATDDPEGKIREFLDKALAEADDTLDYEKDIKPWLGDRAAVWLGKDFAANGDPTGAGVVAVTDEEKAMDAIVKGSEKSGEKLTKRTYKDVEYQVSQDGVAAGTSDGFLLLGPEADVKRAIDAQDGDSLGDSDRYKDGIDALEDEGLAHFWMDFKGLFDLAAREEPSDQEIQQLKQVIPFDKLPPIVGSFQADGERLALEVGVKGKDLDQLGPLASSYGNTPTEFIGELPGDAWGAFGAADYGQGLKTAFGQYAGMFGGAAVKQQLQSQYGINLDEDVLSWIGDVAFYIRGESVESLDGALVIQVVDEGKAAKGFGKLIGLLQSMGGVRAKPTQIEGAEAAFSVADPSIPKPIVMARSKDKVVISFGEEAARDSFAPASKLADSEIYGQSKEALDGMEPILLVSMPAIVKLVDASGSADPSWDQARPYLDAYNVIAYGVETKDDAARIRFAAGLK
jgi:uncharacterized protein DUF3352